MKRFLMTAVLAGIVLSGCSKEYCTVALHYRRAQIDTDFAEGKEECEDNVCTYRMQVQRNRPFGDFCTKINIISEKEIPLAGWYTGKNEKEFYTQDLLSAQTNHDIDLYAGFAEEGEPNWIYGIHGWWYRHDDQYLKNAWIEIDDEKYHFDSKGNLTTGWYYEKGVWYYMKGDGIMNTGWLHLDNRWYYFSEQGALMTGWQTIDGAEYYFYDGGMMAGGWVKDESGWYFFDDEGTRMQGLMNKEGKTYYFDHNGALVRNAWQEVSGEYHYFAEDGTMVKNSWIGEYYLDDNGVRARDCWIGKYHVGPDGKWDQTRMK